MRSVARRAVLVSLFGLVTALAVAAAEAPPPDHPQGWLGVLLAGPGGMEATESLPGTQEGVLVRGVVQDSPAQKARIRAKDLIVAVNGTAVATPRELMSLLRGLTPGSSAALSVRRGSHDLDLDARLDVRPAETEGMNMVAGWLGVEGIQLPPSLRDHFGAPEDAGILVSRVASPSPAEDAGIRIGDVIYEADGKPVTSLPALSGIVTEAGVDNSLEVVLARDGARIVVEPKVAPLPKN